MGTIVVDINSIQLDVFKVSYKRPDPAMFLRLKTSIQILGQIRPIVVNEDMVIIEGSKIYLALKDLGLQMAQVIKVSDDKKEIARIVLNETWFESDYAELGQILKKVPNYQSVLPLSEQDIIDYIEFSTFDPESLKEFKPQLGLFDGQA